jgi:hypothetical protein
MAQILIVETISINATCLPPFSAQLSTHKCVRFLCLSAFFVELDMVLS